MPDSRREHHHPGRCSQVRENNIIRKMEHPWAAYPMRQTRAAAQFSNAPFEMRMHAPLLGEHSEEVLREVGGMSPAQVTALMQAGITKVVKGQVPDKRKINPNKLVPQSG